MRSAQLPLTGWTFIGNDLSERWATVAPAGWRQHHSRHPRATVQITSVAGSGPGGRGDRRRADHAWSFLLHRVTEPPGRGHPSTAQGTRLEDRGRQRHGVVDLGRSVSSTRPRHRHRGGDVPMERAAPHPNRDRLRVRDVSASPSPSYVRAGNEPDLTDDKPVLRVCVSRCILLDRADFEDLRTADGAGPLGGPGVHSSS